ncbi:hypothetical protein ABZV67_12735 [Streptomyces sp. NPDC005065]
MIRRGARQGTESVLHGVAEQPPAAVVDAQQAPRLGHPEQPARVR